MADIPPSKPAAEFDQAATDAALLGPEDPALTQPEPAQVADGLPTAGTSQAARPGREGKRMRVAGIGLAVFGTCLAAAPHVSSAAARALAPLSAPELVGCVGIACGLLLIFGGLLRRSLVEIRGSLETVNAETARLAELAYETQVLGSSVECVQQANQELKHGVAGIQKQIERLTEIASDPNNSVSMFRLAASVDQLHARLDISIKDQLKGMRQQFGELVERTEKSGFELGARIADLGQRLSEEHVAQQAALAERLEPTHAITTRSAAGVEANLKAAARIEAQIAAGREAQAEALESMVVELMRGTEALSRGLEELGGRLERRIAGQAGPLDERLERIDGALESMSVDWLQRAALLNSGLEELGGRLERRIAGQAGPLDERLERIDGALESMSVDWLQRAAQLNTGLEELGGRLERRIAGQAGPLDARLERIDGALASMSVDWLQRAALLNTGLEELGSELARRIQERTGSLDRRLERIDVALERSGKERDELARGLAARLEQELAANSTALEQRVESVAELARRAEQLGGELNAMLAALGPGLAEQHDALQLALAEGIERVHTVSTQSGVAAEESLKAVARLETSLHAAREASTQALAFLHEDWSKDAAQRDAQALEIAARLAQLVDTLTDLAGAASRADAHDLERDDSPSEAVCEHVEAPGIPDQAAELHPEPPPALPTSIESRSELIP